VSAPQLPEVQTPAVHLPLVPHCAFEVQAPAVQVPLVDPELPEPQTLLSQSAALWQDTPPPIEQVPLLPVPQLAASQSVFAWHTWPVP
jgi:hypothetical protein